MSAEGIFVCPQCKGPLDEEARASSCRRCGRTYPVVLGIPDFRVFADPYISIEDDYQKGRLLAQQAEALSFFELVARYWEMTPGVPRDLAKEFTRHAVSGTPRGRQIWNAIQDGAEATSFDSVLEVGCGTGALLVVAAAAARHVVGVDIAFRWLVIARKRLKEAGLPHVRLVCACAEFLPFPDDAFGLVVADDVLDHARDADRLIGEGTRVVNAKSGVFFLSTPNRYSLGPDPHVWVWGVGYLPRRLRDRYVRWRRGIPFGPIHPVSYLGLRRLLARGGLAYRITVAPVSDAARRGLPPWQAALARLYNTVSRVPGVRSMLLYVGPVLQAWCRKVPAGERSTVARTAR